MIVKAWRITKERYSKDAFSGEGSREYGGRWNSRGRAVVYTSQHASLAILEQLVHLGLSQHLQNYVLIECSFDDKLITRINIKQLPPDWRTFPTLVSLQALGNAWYDSGSSVVLQVPSAIIPIEQNYLMNPEHTDFTKVIIGKPQKFAFDERLV